MTPRWWRDPNPVVRKELLGVLRTPLYVRSVVVALILIGLLVVLSALAMSDESERGEVGRTLFQVFVGGTFMVMSVVGSTFGATAIVMEREGRTLDALILAGITPARLVRGKLAAVFAAMAFIPALAAPMLSAAVIFGGVTLGHIVVAAAYLALFGAVAVAFGLSASAHAGTTRHALAGTLPASLLGTIVFGSVMSALGIDYARSHALTYEGPLFLCDAYFALPWGAEYAVHLVLIPGYVIGMTLWLLLASAHNGLMDATEDRALGLKRWAIAASASGVAITALSTRWMGTARGTREGLSVMVLALTTLVGAGLSMAFVGERLHPSRRMLRQAPAVLAPTLRPAVWFVVVWTTLTATLGPMAVCGMNRTLMLGGLSLAAWIAALAGVGGALAARDPLQGATRARIAVAVLVFLSCVGSWVTALLLDATHEVLREPGALMGLSPTWVLGALIEAINRAPHALSPAASQVMSTGAVVWGLVAAAGLGAMHRVKPSP